MLGKRGQELLLRSCADARHFLVIESRQQCSARNVRQTSANAVIAPGDIDVYILAEFDKFPVHHAMSEQ